MVHFSLGILVGEDLHSEDGWNLFFRLDAGFRPGSRATFVSAKVAKTIDAPSGLIEEEGR